MNTSELITVIVPVYNSELYLNTCIESILNQTWHNFELIIIEDGSPDNCAELCDKWSKVDNRVKIVHTANGGAGAARNKALDLALGKYIAFVDSDDYVSPVMLEVLHSFFDDKDIDVVECGFKTVTQDREKLDGPKDENIPVVYTALEAISGHISDHIFKQVIWNKLYRKELIENIRFPLRKSIDDEFWTYKVLGKARKLVHIDSKYYAYRTQNLSVMHRLSNAGRLEAIEARIERHEYVLEKFGLLEGESLISLWSICLFQGQKILQEKSDETQSIKWIQSVLKRYPIKNVAGECSLKQRIWYSMAALSFKNTCKIRNFLKIGN